jgi:glycine reductase
MEIFELGEVDPSLPRIIYILTTLSMSNDPRPTVIFYGLPVLESLPVFIHPNEIIDGVLTRDACHGNPIWLSTTWGFLNNPVVFGLLREHGKRLNFLGVILQRTRFESEHGKHVTAQSTSQLARLLRADGAIITNSTPSGNNLMDLMWTVEGCERKGVKTVLLTPEGGISPIDPPFPFYVPEANAMVSTGCYIERGEIELPVPSKVIGIDKDQPIWFLMGGQLFSPWDKLTDIAPLIFTDGIDWTGNMHNILKEY